MKKKVLFVVPSLVGGGAERVLVLLLRYLNRSRFKSTVVAFNSKNDYKSDFPNDVEIISLKRKERWEWYNIRLIFFLSNVIKKEKPELICSFLSQANLLSILAKRHSGVRVPLIISERNNLSMNIKTATFNLGILSPIRGLLIKKLYPKADCIVCVSTGVKDDLIQNWGAMSHKTTVIYNPVEINHIKTLAKEDVEHPWFKQDFPVIVACGRLVKQKNYPLMIRAFALLSKRCDSRLIVLGEGGLRTELIGYAKKMCVSEKIEFLGFQKNPFKYIARSKALILSSSWEGFGNVLIEGMACGTPVISTRCPSGPDELITDGVNGLLVPVNDEKGLADAIIRLLNNESFRKQLIEAGKIRAEEFRVEKITAEYERIFDSI